MKKIAFFLFFLVVSVNSWAAVPTTEAQASFSCKDARSQTEKLVCSSEKLSESDRDLAKEWKKISDTYTGGQRKPLLDGQRRWLKFRETACRVNDKDLTDDDRINCLTILYDARAEQLEAQLLAHQANPLANIDYILDEKIGFGSMVAVKLSESGKVEDVNYEEEHSPQTCRELYALEAGNRTYSNDTIGNVGSSDAETKCSFKMLDAIGGKKLSKDKTKQLNAQLEKAMQTTSLDEAEFHDVEQKSYGDFTHNGRDEILARVYYHDTGTMRGYSLFLSYANDTDKHIKILRLNTDKLYPADVELDYDDIKR
jgi:uncharacterized protein YecT (DUF1311 family)